MPAPPVIVCSSHNEQPGWRWIEPALPTDRARFEIFDCQPKNVLERRVRRPYVARYRAALEAGRCAKRMNAPLIVSHLPLMSAWTAVSAAAQRAGSHHLAFAFNFTNLPHGSRRKFLARALSRIDRFVVPSSVERRLYAEHLGLPEARIDVLLWGIRKPEAPPDMAPAVTGDYLCAVGGEGRDYRTLIEAMRRLPQVKLVAVVRPHSLAGIDVPDNVHVLVNAPRARANHVMAHARAMVVPLRDAEVPCGHVTIVSGMYLRTPMIVTDSAGVHDYVQHEDNALLCAPRDPAQLAQAIERLWDDPPLGARLAERAERFVLDHCTEAQTAAYFERYLQRLGL